MYTDLDIFYFSSTHWDREWYQSFQGFRFRLVKLIDNLLKLFENDSEYIYSYTNEVDYYYIDIEDWGTDTLSILEEDVMTF